MNNSYYLYKNLSDTYPEYKKEIEYLKYEIDKRVYYYGKHFKISYEEAVQSKTNKTSFLEKIKNLLKKKHKNYINNYDKCIVIRPYSLNANLIKYLKKNNYNTEKPLYLNSKNKILKDLNNTLMTADLNQLISCDFLKEIRIAYNILREYYSAERYKILIIPFDMPFWEKMIIDVFRELGKKTFIYLHGLPAIYNNIDNNRADFLIVWGKKIEENYEKLGIPSNKILILGNMKYEGFMQKELKFSFENILVISHSVNGAQHGLDIVLQDRGNCISYLYIIEKELKKFGVERVRIRVHPSENKEWYEKYIDTNFYTIDSEELKISLKKSTLVIGPSSTVLLDSIYHGCNYLVFEPEENGESLSKYKIVDPFDGNNKKIPVAKTKEELNILLTEKRCLDPSVFEEYNDLNYTIDFLKR